MSKIEFPKQLKQLLEDSDLQAPIRAFADRIGEILTDNKLPFFPHYTDHGIDHVNCVLKSQVELVPKEVWEGSSKDADPRLLCDADAAIIIGATLLHDMAMHLRPDGFRELVSGDSRFQPLSWFKESHEGHSADRDWQGLWEDFVREARRFSDRDLANIIGEESARVWKFHELPDDVGQWEVNHVLIIGEFIRRHHARLAHEIAIYGFPGLPTSGEGHFPAMGEEEGHPLMRLADLIGLAARSHGMNLRVCTSYLGSSPNYLGTPRPMNSAVLYPMALLRVADYLQIDRQRAPAVLLQLRNPQSPVSVQEWKKHRAVQQIVPATSPRGKMVTVTTKLSLSLYLQLSDLLAGLQEELDHSTAVLDETYGARIDLGLNYLTLAIRRVYSNLQSPAFRDSLPYVPNRTGFTADPNLLALLVEPLYGKEPSVGVRELMQNAIDAVCELETWCAVHRKSIASLDLPNQGSNVLIEFLERDDESWYLRVRDRGIGMASDTIQNYFLRAGASFRRSQEWAKEFLDEKGHPRVRRAGRFGIGAFAVFLLGPSFHLWTRHASADASMGYMIDASINSQLIEIKRMDSLPIGTTIEVDLSNETVKTLNLRGEETTFGAFSVNSEPQIDWFCWDWPKVQKRIVRRSKLIKNLGQKYTCPVRKRKLPHDLAVIYPDGFDAIFWGFGNMPKLSCNGLIIGKQARGRSEAGFNWPKETQLNPPCIAVLDSAANLPLTTQRYALSQETLPFINELSRDVTLSYIAHALVCGPTSRADAFSLRPEHPLKIKDGGYTSYDEGKISLRLVEKPLNWCASSTKVIPADPWFFSLLDTDICLVFGTLSDTRPVPSKLLTDDNALATLSIISPDHAIFSYDGFFKHENDDEKVFENPEDISGLAAQMFLDLASQGVAKLGHEVLACRMLVSSSKEFILEPYEEMQWKELESDKNLVRETLFGKESYSNRRWFSAETGGFTTHEPFSGVFKQIENVFQDNEGNPHNSRRSYIPEFLYVAEFLIKKTKPSPESLIARIWNECLGARTIPFDPAAREALLADGCKHPELKQHIEAWREMKFTGSMKG